MLGLALSTVAACGGKSSSSTAPTGGGGGGGGGGGAAAAGTTPFAQDHVQETLAAMPVPESCGGPGAAATLGALLADQRRALGDESETEVAFTCRPNDGEPWSCMWSVMTKPSSVVDPDDPCAEAGSSGYQIMFGVDDAGAIVADSVNCLAPG